MKSVILTMLWLWVYIVPLFAQQEKIEVMGKVTDIKSAPLLGVSITVKDQAGLGVTTDAEGNYKMKVNRYQTLVFSSVGYEKKEVLVKDKLTINVMLQESESNALEEVTITALGPQKKVTVTGAVTTVDVSTLKTPSSSITNALAGNVAGIMAMQSSGQPGSNASKFWIRGISTFGAGTSALVLVDGFERSLNEINVEDIESFSVLKDASTTAIYGSRGANGVVLITTKRGKSGKVSINGKVEGTYNTRTYTPKFADGLTYASLMNEARTTRNQAPFYTESDLSLIREGLDQDIYPNIDWMKLLLKDGAYTKRASLNLDGGGTTARYFVSGSYIDEGGMYSTKDAWEGYDTNANYKRWNYRTNVDMDITKSTLLRIGVSGSLDKQNLPGATYNEIWNSLMGQNPISVPLRYSNGNMSSRGSGGKNNPWVLMTQMGYIENWNNKIQTNVTLEQNFDFLTKGMKFIGRFGFDTNNKNYIRRVKWPTGYQAERNRGNAGEVIFKEVVAEQLLKQESSANGDRSEFLQAELHYNRDFKDHKLGAVIQYSQDKQVNTSSYGTDIMQGIERRNQRLAGRFTYGYQYRYFVDFNFGYNGSENFAKGHQFDLFPAVSGAWNVAEETFIKKNLKWVNIFKIRYSYGKVGNDYMEKNGKRIRFPYLATFTNDENTTN
ncbi:MAG TPA: SusC/RagA family protein, partial [Sphingobacterium sp.]|nr:SusC/RagA family protein [Sphingobacterium sp.]